MQRGIHLLDGMTEEVEGADDETTSEELDQAKLEMASMLDEKSKNGN